MEFYSHPKPNKIFLKDHLEKVAECSKEKILSKKLEELNVEILADISYLIGISHDFGKFTTFFQDKIKGAYYDNKANHSLISSLFAFELIAEYLKQKKITEKPYIYLPLIAYFVVKHHHGSLKNIKNDTNLSILFKSGFCDLQPQLENINENLPDIKDIYFKLLSNYDLDFDEIYCELNRKYNKKLEYSEDLKPVIKAIKTMEIEFEDNEQNIIYYLLVQFLYSVLIDSDKKHAGGVREIDRKELSDELVEDYLKNPKFKDKNKSNINPIREKIRKSALENIEKEYKNYKIFTLTAPTGTGKTLTSFSVALKLKKLLKKELKLRYEPRIIYSLPFTSIIDQNFDVFDRVLNQIEDFEEYKNEYILKHHHLSDIFYKTKNADDENISIEESLALIESWESEIIVTTFIQLFYTLIGYKNRTLKKFHNIVNSIIILDEVQNIPLEYWELIRDILVGMTKYFNCRVILMTATKPLIFDDGTYKELVEDYENYFGNDELNRVCLYPTFNEKTVDNFCTELNDWSKNSYLFVLNTIGSSLKVYEYIKKIKSELGFKLYYLSTNITPKDRRNEIDKIKENLREINKLVETNQEIKDNQKVVIVSTQLIEAGVDIDCDCVYRDIGPFDSIMQVAGRCNRNKKLDVGEVHLVNLVGEDKNGKEYSYVSQIYGKNSELLKITFDILKYIKEIKETEFLKLINNYFKESKKESVKEDKLIKSIYNLNYYDESADKTKIKPISEFRLIEKDYPEIDVFVELDDEAKKVWKKYCELKNNKELKGFERKKEFLKIKKDFYDYVISIPLKHKDKVWNENLNIGYISKEDIGSEKCYDPETGFIGDEAICGNLIF